MVLNSGIPTGEIALILLNLPVFLDSWRIFCYFLGFSSHEAKLLATQYVRGTEFPCYFSLINEILENWVRKMGQEAKIGTLIQVAFKMKNLEMADTLKERYPDLSLALTKLPVEKKTLAVYQKQAPDDVSNLIERLNVEEHVAQQPGQIKLLHVVPDVEHSFGRIVVFLSRMMRILSNIGDRPVVVVSINGKMRSGKSFMANHFLKYLKFQGQQDKSWLDKKLNGGFKWGAGAERVTSGIEMWNEPIMLKGADGKELAVIILDTQGLHDLQTNSQENKLIFGFSALISSIFIYNEKCVDSLVLQDLHSSLEFAKFAGSDENQMKFQKLILLLRDWDIHTFEYAYGHYDKNYRGDKNLMDFIFRSNNGKSADVSNTRSGIMNNFEDVSVFAMSSPYRNRPELEEYTESTSWDNDFRSTLISFVETILSMENLQNSVKTVAGEPMTGTKLKDFVKRWVELILEFEGDFEFKTIFETTAEIIYSKRIESLFQEFQRLIQQQLENTPNGLDQMAFHNLVQGKKADGIRKFQEMNAFGSANIQMEFRNKLEEKLNKSIENFTGINSTNLERHRLEQERLANERRLREQEKQRRIALAEDYYQQARVDLEVSRARRDEIIRNQQSYRSPHEVRRRNRVLGVVVSPTRFTEWRYDDALYQNALGVANADVHEKQVRFDEATARLNEARNS